MTDSKENMYAIVTRESAGLAALLRWCRSPLVSVIGDVPQGARVDLDVYDDAFGDAAWAAGLPLFQSETRAWARGVEVGAESQANRPQAPSVSRGKVTAYAWRADAIQALRSSIQVALETEQFRRAQLAGRFRAALLCGGLADWHARVEALELVTDPRMVEAWEACCEAEPGVPE